MYALLTVLRGSLLEEGGKKLKRPISSAFGKDPTHHAWARLKRMRFLCVVGDRSGPNYVQTIQILYSSDRELWE